VDQSVEDTEHRSGLGVCAIALVDDAIDTAESAARLVLYYTRRGFRRVDDAQWPGKRYRSVVLSKTLSP